MQDRVQSVLEQKVRQYNRPDFIPNDPIAIPHQFSQQADIEIAGFFAAIFAWGNRTTILNKSRELLQLMDNAPHQFIRQHQEKDLKKLLAFKHRTFQSTDLFYFIEFLRHHYKKHQSLQEAFLLGGPSAEQRLDTFHDYFFSLPDAPERTRKHVACPQRGSTCKRLNMFLRWMVRKDKMGVDFGIWKKIKPAELICPVDVHVSRVARKLGLIERKQTDWETAMELTETLRSFDSKDPVKYDFALVSLGVNEKF
ncbi:MAG: TIGR02757 family protein [Bacteroidota bacterium]